MATSISKLAIFMTVDTSGMITGFAQAQNLVRQFDSQISGGAGGGIGSLDRGMMAFSKSITKAKFEAKDLALAFGMSGGVAAAIGAAVVVSTRFLSNMLQVRQAMEQAALEARRAWEEASAAVGEFDGKLTDTADTFSGQWTRIWNEQGAAASSYFDGVLTRWKNLMSAASAGIAAGTEGHLGGTSFARNEEEVRLMKEKTAELKKQAELMAKQAAEAARQREHELKAMADRANSLTKAMRTPAETYVDAMREVTRLLEANAISVVTAFRAAQQARADLVKASGIAVDTKKFAEVRIGAAERGTAAGLSAAVSRDYAALRMAQIQQAQLAAQNKANSILEEIRRLQSKESPPSVVFKPSNF